MDKPEQKQDNKSDRPSTIPFGPERKQDNKFHQYYIPALKIISLDTTPSNESNPKGNLEKEGLGTSFLGPLIGAFGDKESDWPLPFGPEHQVNKKK